MEDCLQRMRTFTFRGKTISIARVSYVEKSGFHVANSSHVTRHLVAQFSALAHPDDKQISTCPRNFKPRSLPKRSSANRATNPSQSKIAPFVVCPRISLISSRMASSSECEYNYLQSRMNFFFRRNANFSADSKRIRTRVIKIYPSCKRFMAS